MNAVSIILVVCGVVSGGLLVAAWNGRRQRAAAAAAAVLAAELESAQRLVDSTRQQRDESRRALETAKRDLAVEQTRCTERQRQVAERDEHAQQLVGELAELRRALDAARADVSGAERRVATLQTQLEDEKLAAADKLKTLEQAALQMEERFKGIAAQVLEQNTQKFETNTRVRLAELLSPLGEQIKEFQHKADQKHQRDIEDRTALHGELKHFAAMGQRLDEDATNLTKALRGDSRTQGAWGEVVLGRILEQCGLREGIEFERQATFAGDDDTRLRPDVVVRLPGSRSVVLDAKVSLTAYSDYVSSEDEGSRAAALRRHLESIRSHIKGLSSKEYWSINALDAGDYVLMFVPTDSAFADCMRHDNALIEDAYRHNVVVTSPSMLLATLRTIEHAWRGERQNEAARAVMDQAAKLYDTFVTFVVELQKVGNRLQQAQDAYGSAMNRLSQGRGNLIRRAEQLRSLGLKGRKSLPKGFACDAEAAPVSDADDRAGEASAALITV